jgi:hypothetical protein
MSATSESTDALWRRVFLSTAIFNFTVAGSLLLAPEWLFVELGFRPVPGATIFVHGFALAIGLFGLGYYWVSRDPTQCALVRLGLLSKLAVFGLMLGHVWAGHASWHPLALGCVDLVYAGLFVVFLRHRRTPVRSDRRMAGVAQGGA